MIYAYREPVLSNLPNKAKKEFLSFYYWYYKFILYFDVALGFWPIIYSIIAYYGLDCYLFPSLEERLGKYQPYPTMAF